MLPLHDFNKGIGIMKKDKALMIFLIFIILFNVFFITMLICYKDIIVLPTNFSLTNVTKEYYFWYLDRPRINNESVIIGITSIVKLIFSVTFLLDFFYIISNKKYMDVIGKRNVIISIIIGFVIYCLSFILIKYKAEHYRLFMDLILTEVLSLVVLNLILTLKKSINIQ